MEPGERGILPGGPASNPAIPAPFGEVGGEGSGPNLVAGAAIWSKSIHFADVSATFDGADPARSRIWQ